MIRLAVLQPIGSAVAKLDASGKGELAEPDSRCQVLSVFFPRLGIPSEGEGPRGEGELQLGLDRVAADYVVSEEKDLL